jgi:hypothetical protein
MAAEIETCERGSPARAPDRQHLAIKRGRNSKFHAIQPRFDGYSRRIPHATIAMLKSPHPENGELYVYAK